MMSKLNDIAFSYFAIFFLLLFPSPFQALNMPSKNDKHYANSRVRRHSGEVVLSRKKSKKDKDKDTDSESVTTSSSADTLVEPKCPLRYMLTSILETQIEDKGQAKGCPLRHVQLWHTIPLCLFGIINLLLVIVALLGLASYRIIMGTQAVVVSFAKAQLNFESFTKVVPDMAKDPSQNE